MRPLDLSLHIRTLATLAALLAATPSCVTLPFFSEETSMPTRDDAWKLLCEYTQSESLRKHMLAVETCVRAYARKNGADEELVEHHRSAPRFRLRALAQRRSRRRQRTSRRRRKNSSSNAATPRKSSAPFFRTPTIPASPASRRSSTRSSPATNSPAFSPPARTCARRKAFSIWKWIR